MIRSDQHHHIITSSRIHTDADAYIISSLAQMHIICQWHNRNERFGHAIVRTRVCLGARLGANDIYTQSDMLSDLISIQKYTPTGSETGGTLLKFFWLGFYYMTTPVHPFYYTPIKKPPRMFYRIIIIY